MGAYQTLLKHEDLITLIEVHEYIPQSSNVAWGELVGAYKEITGKGYLDMACSGCVGEIIKMCRIYLNEYKKSLSPEVKAEPVFMTFPEVKEEPKKEKRRRK